MYCHDQEVMSSSSDWVELGVLGTSVLRRTFTEHNNINFISYLIAWLGQNIIWQLDYKVSVIIH